MRRLLPLLCGLLLAACGQRAARPIGDFTLPVYTPRYASGFEITGAAGSRSTLVTVHNPWYGDEVTDQYLFIARDGEPAPAGFEGRCCATRRGAWSACRDPTSPCSTPSERPTAWWASPERNT